MLKGGSRCIFLLVTLVDAVFKMCTKLLSIGVFITIQIHCQKMIINK